MDFSTFVDIAGYVVMGFGGVVGTVFGIDKYREYKAEERRKSFKSED